MPYYKRACNLSKRQLKRRLEKLKAQSVCTGAHSIQPESSENGTRIPEIDEEIFFSDDSFQNSDDGSSNSFESSNRINFRLFLCNWKNKYNVTNNAVNALLCYLVESKIYTDLPKDCRTLMSTPTTRNIVRVEPGNYVHIGLKLALDAILSTNESVTEIILDFNIDGVPISKSSTSSLWLILGKVYNLPDESVFVIGAYHGFNKPSNFNDFLRPHVDE